MELDIAASPDIADRHKAKPFDRTTLRMRRDRAAGTDPDDLFLIEEVTGRLVERLGETTGQFALALDLGCRQGQFARAMAAAGHESKIGTLVQSDMAPAMARAASANGAHPTLVADEEALPFAAARFDLVVSALGLHMVNDLPGTLLQIRHILKPGGLFLAAMFGAGTLNELRHVWLDAEATRTGGASPRVAPFADLGDAASLLQRAGFDQPVADGDRIAVSYEDPLRLMADLKAMGESNSLAQRSPAPVTRGLLAEVASRYRALYAGGDGRVRARFEILFLTAWAPEADIKQSLGRIATA